MLRIRKTDEGYEIAITYKTNCSAEDLESCISNIKDDIGSKLDGLAINAVTFDFDEVRIDNNGSLPAPKQKETDTEGG